MIHNRENISTNHCTTVIYAIRMMLTFVLITTTSQYYALSQIGIPTIINHTKEDYSGSVSNWDERLVPAMYLSLMVPAYSSTMV